MKLRIWQHLIFSTWFFSGKKSLLRPQTHSLRSNSVQRKIGDQIFASICVWLRMKNLINPVWWPHFFIWRLKKKNSVVIWRLPKKVNFGPRKTYNTIAWQTLFTCHWRWLPLRKHQSPTTVLLRTTLSGKSHYTLVWWSFLFSLLQIMSNHMSLAFFLVMLRSEPSVPVHLFKALNFPNLDSSPKESTCTWLLQAMCGGWFLCQYPCRSSSCYMTNSSV